VITFRRVSVNLQHYHRTNTSCISSVCCCAQLVTGLKPITSHPLLTMKEVTSWWDKGLRHFPTWRRWPDTRDGCYNDSWPIWTFHSSYKQGSHRWKRLSSTGAPQSDGVLNTSTGKKMRYYRQIYTDSPDPIVFLPVSVSTSGRVYDDFTRLFSCASWSHG